MSMPGGAAPSGSVDDVYNVCPVVVEFTEEQENLSDGELKANAADAAMSAYLLSHPNNTLWDYFKIERRQKKAMNKNLPLKNGSRTPSRVSLTTRPTPLSPWHRLWRMRSSGSSTPSETLSSDDSVADTTEADKTGLRRE
ncbi:hypothetical protein PI125_g13613 [Phytophthora idaei]|nr:hypothetical protein PI125_g13613 [Phytophthora idaei]